MYATVKNLADAHELACATIMNSHREISIQTHIDKEEFTLEYSTPMYITVLEPLAQPQISAGALFGKKMAEAYKKQFLTLTPPRADGLQAVYTYYNRLKDYPIISDSCPPGCKPNEDDCRFCLDQMMTNGDGNGKGYDQILATVAKLAADPNSRRGIMVTWNPSLDAESLEPPCMDLVQFVIREGRLHMRVVFRSQDMLSALGENLIGCTALFEHILNLIKSHPDYHQDCPLEMGHLTLISLIPHIYKKRDSQEFGMMRQQIHTRKMQNNWHFQYVI